ncbi:MAG: trypsin-like peptidase domain-containing protein [Anaerohalosphaeraceae bacterium]
MGNLCKVWAGIVLGVIILSQPGAGQVAQEQISVDFREIVQAAKDKVFPAVVYIKCLSENHESGKKITQEVGGSGTIISPDGEILTNWHVVDKAVEIRCLLYSGASYYAKLIGSDKDTDLALLKLERKGDTAALSTAKLGDSTVLKEGDFVMAMGAPWGLSRSVSIGIISCTHRYLPQGEYSLWLQTDAAISPGNSGGPLVNTKGEIVGINTLGELIGGDLGFAVPSETIQYMLPQFRQFGKVNWSWLGLQLQPLRDFNRNIYFDATEGVMVAETDPDSPARKAGIAARDRIIRIGGKPVTAATEEDLPVLRRTLGLLEKEKAVEVELIRNQETIKVQLTPTEKGKVQGDELDCPRWDFTVKTINQFENPDLYYYRKEGVFIFGIKYPGNASNSNLREQDIILKIDGQDVKTLDDVRKIHADAIAAVQQKNRCIFTVLRNGLMQQAVLEFSRDYEKH